MFILTLNFRAFSHGNLALLPWQQSKYMGAQAHGEGAAGPLDSQEAKGEHGGAGIPTFSAGA